MRVWIGALLACVRSGVGAGAAPSRSARRMSRPNWFPPAPPLAPGETFQIALRQKIIPGWHTYWRNPGDSGEPTEADLAAAAGFRAGELQWPAPEALPFDILMNYGYSGEVLFPIEITAPPADAALGRASRSTADVTWLVCSDICIPEAGRRFRSRCRSPQQARDDPSWAPRVARRVAALPQVAEGGDGAHHAGAPQR